MLCCGGCFKNNFLKKHISFKSLHVGNCSFCDNQNVDLIDPASLSNLFSPVIDLYKRVEAGSGLSLVKLLRSDWNLFLDVEDSKAESILKYLFEDQDFIFCGFESRNQHGKDDAVKWDEFKVELKHDNRYFPKSFPEHENLILLLSYLSVQTERDLDVLFRARKNKNKERYHIDDMWQPPENIVTAGRANPFGIAYLYAASTVKTALSELRPHKGELFTIANFNLTGSLKLIDLRNPRDTVSPFRYSDEELLNIYIGLNLLVKLGEELTKPISKDKAHLEYLSSQYLCEFIKSQNYEGVIYKSSLGDGDNYALFDWSKLDGVKTRVYQISGVDITAGEIGQETIVERIASKTAPAATGRVKWFNDSKGYGFIKNDSDGRDIFVHYTSIIGNSSKKSLEVGDRVTFSVGTSRKGDAAVGVNRIN